MVSSAEAGSTLYDSITPRLGSVWVQRPTYFGRQIQLCLSDAAVSKTIMLTGDWEPAVGRQILKMLRPGDTFLDVGANIGWFSLLAGDFLARSGSGRVIAIEANPTLVPHISASIVKSGLADVISLKPYAVSDRIDVVEMSVSEQGNVGGLSIAPLSGNTNKNVVPALPLDVLLADVPRIDLIKMDIEGAEPLAIAGGADLLRKHRPKIIMEINGDGLSGVSGHSVDDLLRQMAAFGYSPWRFKGLDDPQMLSRAQTEDLVAHHGYDDVLFLM
ncbi:hypothetical protein A0J57_23465 [Sphingobium sp. 22B]|nr:hypothetical protein AXW74_22170 [Sphingobium sp. AM]KYC29877.1 hypothetical protein A0J57_23465 [Sphingobium sp. 22B]